LGCLPYEDRERKEALSKTFKVRGIPTLVVLDESGALITADGRSKIAKDPQGESFPWKPKSLSELLAGDLLGKSGTVPSAALDDKVVGLYFSAHWCPPCRGFTPRLVEQYEKIKVAGLPLEIVFASSDKDEEAFGDYFKDMPWLALPYADRSRKEDLSNRFDVSGIPSLVLLDKDRSVITTDGRGAIMGDLSKFPFHPEPVQDLAESQKGLNEAVCVMVMAETSGKDAQEAARSAMAPIASEYVAAAKASGEEQEVRFFVACGGGPAPTVRQKCSLEAALPEHEHPLQEQEGGGWYCDGCGGNTGPRYRCTKGCDFDYCSECHAKVSAGSVTLQPPQLVVLNIGDSGAYYTPACALTEAGLRTMLADFKAGVLTRKQMG